MTSEEIIRFYLVFDYAFGPSVKWTLSSAKSRGMAKDGIALEELMVMIDLPRFSP